MHIKEARPTEKKKRAMGAPARSVEQNRDGGGGGGGGGGANAALPSSPARRKRAE